MSGDLESQLRAALRPIAPSEALEKKLIGSVTEKPGFAPAKPGRFDRGGARSRTRWLSIGMAACLLIGVGLQHRLHERHERETGLEARRQVVEALRMTSQKLDLAYAIVRSQSTSLTDEDPGA
jgi:hypothetical protein